MASYGPAASMHKTLGSGVDTCTVTGARRAQVINRSANPIWWRADGIDPVASADGTMYLPGLSADVAYWPADTWTGQSAVKLIGTTGSDYSVQADWGISR